MNKNKKRYSIYKELIAEKLANKKLKEEKEKEQEIRRVAEIGVNFAKQLGISEADILNSMGMYRFGLQYDGEYEK